VHRDLKPATSSSLQEANRSCSISASRSCSRLTTPRVSLTLADHQRLTPAYASPEQVRGEPITTVSDVYALGALLYELLTGQSAHRFSQVPPSPTELLRVVADETPERPSSAAKGTPFARSLRGDLDNILLQALRKEPARRYPGVNSLAEDVRRYLGNFPVRARKDTVRYRTSKFIRRNRVGVAAASLGLMALFTGLAATAWQAHVARTERKKAVQHFNQVRRLARSVLFDYHDAIANLGGSTHIREKLVRDSLDYLDTLAKEGSSDASLEREIASAYLKVGDVQGEPYTANLGDTDGALASYERARSILERLARDEPSEPAIQFDLSRAYQKLSQIHVRRAAGKKASRCSARAQRSSRGWSRQIRRMRNTAACSRRVISTTAKRRTRRQQRSGRGSTPRARVVQAGAGGATGVVCRRS
jgi:tetratricopeptide (TPR) repeat protein